MYQEPAPDTGGEIAITPPRKTIWGPWATLGFGVVVVFGYFMSAVFVIVITSVVVIARQAGTALDASDLGDIIMANLGLLIAMAGIVSGIVGLALILAVIKVRRGGRGVAEYLGLKRVGWRTLLLLLLVTGVYLALVSVAGSLAHVDEGDTGMLVQAYETSVWPALLWIAVVVFAPVFEEPLARGFLFEGFRNSRLGLAGAILLTSLIWASLHVGYSLFSIGAIFIFGIALGYVRYRTGSLWSTMLMHAFYNAVGMALIAWSLV
jgi:membrane protease YdiL (CAAX protease family)